MTPVPYPVSVQICTLNEEENIGPCLEAVWTNDPAEVLIIDGGSSDATVSIAQGLGATVLSPGKLGLGASRQVGYQAATQPFSAFIDADDRISPEWIKMMLADMEAGQYAALQSSLRAVRTGSFWSRGWDQYFVESVRPMPDTTMVGRPAMFRTEALQTDDSPLPSLDEDTHLSRRFEMRGLRQGIGTALAYRHVEEGWAVNSQKWQSYGRGYRDFVKEHPERRWAIARHVGFTIPIARPWASLRRGEWSQPVFGTLMAMSIARGWSDRRGARETPRVGS